MYGTVARIRIKPGMESKLKELTRSYEGLKIPGHKATYVYRLDSGNDEYIMSVVFEDKAAYTKNANDPAQDARFREMAALLAGEPQWNDGEIIYGG